MANTKVRFRGPSMTHMRTLAKASLQNAIIDLHDSETGGYTDEGEELFLIALHGEIGKAINRRVSNLKTRAAKAGK